MNYRMLTLHIGTKSFNILIQIQNSEIVEIVGTSQYFLYGSSTNFKASV
jgi:hypothetical protein